MRQAPPHHSFVVALTTEAAAQLSRWQ